MLTVFDSGPVTADTPAGEFDIPLHGAGTVLLAAEGPDFYNAEIPEECICEGFYRHTRDYNRQESQYRIFFCQERE